MRRVKELLQSEARGARLRVKVLGGGCSGFRYDYSFDTHLAAEDCLYGAELVVVDEISLGLIANSTLDYREDLGQAGFVIMNPNASARCGCGSSFAI